MRKEWCSTVFHIALYFCLLPCGSRLSQASHSDEKAFRAMRLRLFRSGLQATPSFGVLVSTSTMGLGNMSHVIILKPPTPRTQNSNNSSESNK